MSEPFRPSAAFSVPLTDDQFIWLGKLAPLWSQYEMMIEVSIYHLQGLTFDDGRRTELRRDIGRRIGKLQALAGDKIRQPERQAALDLCLRGAALAPKRNLAFHGQWSRPAPDHPVVRAASWFKVPPGQRLPFLLADDLPQLVRDVAELGLDQLSWLESRGAIAPLLYRPPAA
jgi:hypothetical protein